MPGVICDWFVVVPFFVSCRLQVSAQQVYMALLEASSNNVGGVLAEAVAKMLSQGVSEQIETCRQSTARLVLVLTFAICLLLVLGVVLSVQVF